MARIDLVKNLFPSVAAFFRNREKLYNVALFLSVFLFIAQAIVYVFFLEMGYDEGCYLYDSWLVFHKGWIPYHNMFVRTPPLSYYFYGFFQSLLGPSFYIGRLESIIFCALMLLVLFKFSKKIGGKWAGLIAVWLVVSNTYSMGHYSSADLYSMTTLFMMSSLLVLVSDLKESFKTILSITLMCFSFLTRHDMGPVALILVLYVILTQKKKKITCLAISTFMIVPLLTMLPFLIIDFDRTTFDLFNPIHRSFPAPYAFGGWFTWIDRMMVIIDICQKYYFLLTLLFVALAVQTRKFFTANKRQILQRYRICILVVCMLIVSVLVHLLIGERGRTFTIYTLYSIPLAASLVGIGIVKFYVEFKSQVAKSFLAAILIIGIILTPISMVPEISTPWRTSDIQEIQKIAEIIESYTKPEDKIFTMGNQHIIFLAKRTALTYNFGQYTTLNNTEFVKHYYYYNLDVIDEWLSGEADAVIISKTMEECLLHSTRYEEGHKIWDLIQKKLKENYILEAHIPNVWNKWIEIYTLKSQ